MAGRAIPFPPGANPSRRYATSPQTEGNGDLLNAMAVLRDDKTVVWTRTPGLFSVLPTPGDPLDDLTAPRGLLNAHEELLALWGPVVVSVDANHATTNSTGVPISGTGPITWARNLRASPEVAIVTNLGPFLLNMDTMAVSTYPNTPTLPSGSSNNIGNVNSVDYFSGYFIFSRQDGTIVASGLQNAIIPDLSFDKAQYAGDDLLRVVSNGDTLLACGNTSIEIWQDVGKSPFPLQRSHVIPVGLLGQWCIAGGPNTWEHGVLFIAPDSTVRHIQGFEAVPVSNHAVQVDLHRTRLQPELFRTCVYTFEGQAIFQIAHPEFTWEYNVTTAAWHRRESDGMGAPTYRGRFAQSLIGRWYVQDVLPGEGGLMQIAPRQFTELGRPLRWMVESGVMKDLPLAVRVPAVELDCTVGIGAPEGEPEQTDPTVSLSWSHDGGAAWSNPLVRSLGKIGETNKRVVFHNLGRSSHRGVRFRVESSDPVQMTLNGASILGMKPSNPRGVK